MALALVAAGGPVGPLSGQVPGAAGPELEPGRVAVAESGEPGHTDRQAAGRRHVLVPRPLFFHTEEMGWAGGVDVLHSYQRPGRATHPTMSHVYLLYTRTGKAMASVSTDLHTAGNRHRLGAHAMYVYYPHTFHGIGGDLTMEEGEPYTARSVTLALSARRRFDSGLVLGLGWSGERYHMISRVPDGRLADGSVTGGDGGVISRLSTHVGLDTRVGVPAPYRGSYAVATVRGSHPAIGSDYRFAQLDVDARHYIPLPAGHVFAMQAVTSSTLGDAPFQVLPQMGGAHIMRGYSSMLNRDRHLLAAQVEHRLPIWWRFGAAAFAGAGTVAPRPGHIRLEDVRPSYGAGLRFAIHRNQRLNLRADWGMGSAGSVLHVGVGEAF
jgi:hypothetical protein